MTLGTILIIMVFMVITMQSMPAGAGSCTSGRLCLCLAQRFWFIFWFQTFYSHSNIGHMSNNFQYILVWYVLLVMPFDMGTQLSTHTRFSSLDLLLLYGANNNGHSASTGTWLRSIPIGPRSTSGRYWGGIAGEWLRSMGPWTESSKKVIQKLIVPGTPGNQCHPCL